MKHTIFLMLLVALTICACNAQEKPAEKFLQDESLQNEIMATIVGNHNLMIKLIAEIKKSDHASMMINHLLSVTQSGDDKTKSPYVGAESRTVKSLSQSQIDQYLAGEGMGFAMPAELNHYPGPRHVIDLAAKLKLTEDQTNNTKAIFDGMHKKAVSLGKRIVESETVLDKQFADATITPQGLEQATTTIAKLQGTLRATHLEAHLKMKKILTQDQVKRYDNLRGYAMH